MITKLFIILSTFLLPLLPQESKSNNIPKKKGHVSVTEFSKKNINFKEISKGVFTVYRSNKDWYWLIPDSLFQRDFLLTTTLIKGSQVLKRSAKQRFGYAGDMFPARMISFVKEDNSICIVEPKSIAPLNEYIIFEKIDIAAQEKDATLINVTDLVNNNRLFALEPFRILLNIGSFETNNSSVYEIKAFSKNIIIRSERNHRAMPGKQPTRWQVGVSLLLLPEKPMQKRFQDSRVGFFSQRIKKDTTSQKSENIIKRWRIEPQNDDEKKYFSGKLVKPRKPIIFYIDKDTPDYLKPFVKRAVEEWNIAFEQAGFKEVMQAIEEPKTSDHTEFSLDNAAYSFISYKTSPQENAYGPIICDPRSGEIICSHVALYHSLKNLVQGWYFSQCGVIDKRAREWVLPDSLLGNLVKYVVSHEIGHTLGLSHNFLGSSSFSVEEIQNIDFVKENGFGTSIMDYMRFNFLAIPHKRSKLDELIPKIGYYDRFAIEWGYRYFGNLSINEQSNFLENWVSEKQEDKRYQYSNRHPPLAQEEDLSSNPIKANEIGIHNLNMLMANDTLWNLEALNSHSFIVSNRFGAVFRQYQQFIDQVIAFIGGTYQRNKTPLSIIDRTIQKKAMSFLQTYFFNPPKWLMANNLKDIDGLSGKQKMETYYEAATPVFVRKMKALAQQEDLPFETYTLNEYLNDITHALFVAEWQQKKTISSNRAALQQAYVNSLIDNIVNERDLSRHTFIRLINYIASLTKSLKEYQEKAPDAFSKNHAAQLIYVIRKNFPYLSRK